MYSPCVLACEALRLLVYAAVDALAWLCGLGSAGRRRWRCCVEMLGRDALKH